MRRLLALLSFLALAMSPIAAPAASAAMARNAACEMNGSMDHHDGTMAPASSEPCCVAVPADLPAALAMPDAPRVTPVVPLAQAPHALGGAGPTFDDPPPKAVLS